MKYSKFHRHELFETERECDFSYILFSIELVQDTAAQFGEQLPIEPYLIRLRNFRLLLPKEAVPGNKTTPSLSPPCGKRDASSNFPCLLINFGTYRTVLGMCLKYVFYAFWHDVTMVEVPKLFSNVSKQKLWHVRKLERTISVTVKI